MKNTDNHTNNFIVSDLAFVAPRFPQYDFIRLKEENTIGARYKALHKNLERLVNFKVVARRITKDTEFNESYRKCAKAMARLKHQNLVDIYDYGETEDMLYMVEEYVSGWTLEQAANGQKVDPAQALKIILSIAKGVEYAHNHGMIHGNLQPSKIMVDVNIEPKISDFGLAVELRDTNSEYVSAVNPHFTAPEITELYKECTISSDIYSIGAIFYYLLTTTGFVKNDFMPSKLSHCDHRYDDIIGKALKFNPENRYASLTEMIADLEKLKAEIDAGLVTVSAPVHVHETRQTVRVVEHNFIVKEAEVKPKPKFNFPIAG